MDKKYVKHKLLDRKEIKVSNYKEKNHIQKYLTWGFIGFFGFALIIGLSYVPIHIWKQLIEVFFDKNGNFQWVGITSIIAILTFGYSIYSTNKKNRYDVVSKERIRWINDVKQQVTELLVLMNDYYDIVQNCGEKCSLGLNTPDQLKLRDKYHDKANALMGEINFKINILLLSFADNKDNSQIINCVKDAAEWINSFNVYWNSTYNPFVEVTYTFDNVPLRNLLIISRDYLNREWHKAQKGK